MYVYFALAYTYVAVHSLKVLIFNVDTVVYSVVLNEKFIDLPTFAYVCIR